MNKYGKISLLFAIIGLLVNNYVYINDSTAETP